jgi:hypothetical protein
MPPLIDPPGQAFGIALEQPRSLFGDFGNLPAFTVGSVGKLPKMRLPGERSEGKRELSCWRVSRRRWSRVLKGSKY